MQTSFDNEAGTYRYNHWNESIEYEDKDGKNPRTYWRPEEIRNLNDRAKAINLWFRDRYNE